MKPENKDKRMKETDKPSNKKRKSNNNFLWPKRRTYRSSKSKHKKRSNKCNKSSRKE
jgi:hypothetical protein